MSDDPDLVLHQWQSILGLSLDQMLDWRIEQLREFLAMPREQQIEVLKAELGTKDDTAPIFERLTGALTRLGMVLQFVKVAALFGTSKQLRKDLQSYKEKVKDSRKELDDAYVAAVSLVGRAGIEQVVHFFPDSGVSSISDFLDLAEKYHDTLTAILQTKKSSFKPLQVLASTTPDLIEIVASRPQFGRSPGISPINRLLGERADETYWNNPDWSWQTIAEHMYADLLHIEKRSQDEKDMLEWFDDKPRETWGARLNDNWHDWKKRLKSNPE